MEQTAEMTLIGWAVPETGPIPPVSVVNLNLEPDPDPASQKEQ